MDGECKVIAKCPKCGAEHEMTLFWTGRGRPRKYCEICLKIIRKAPSEEDTWKVKRVRWH